VNCRDRAAVQRAIALLSDTSKPRRDRLDAIRALGLTLPPEARALLLETVQKEEDVELRCEACRALAGYDGPGVPRALLSEWKNYPSPVRAEVVNLLAGRKEWATALLNAVGGKVVPRTDLTDNTILRMRAFKDKNLEALVKKVWGEIRDTPAELTKLIDRMRGELYAAPASFERGKKVFDNVCAKCHQFDGRGHEVGPNLDG